MLRICNRCAGGVAVPADDLLNPTSMLYCRIDVVLFRAGCTEALIVGDVARRRRTQGCGVGSAWRGARGAALAVPIHSLREGELNR
jgi:hypothetical protein